MRRATLLLAPGLFAIPALLALPAAAAPDDDTFRVTMPPPPGLAALSHAIDALDDAPPPAPPGTPLPAELPADATGCEAFVRDRAEACRKQDAAACMTIFAIEDAGEAQPCRTSLAHAGTLPPRDAVTLARCIGSEPHACDAAADALDDDGSLAHFRLVIHLRLRACRAGVRTACSGLAGLVRDEPFRVLDDGLARTVERHACLLEHDDPKRCLRPRASSPGTTPLERAVRARDHADVRRLAKTKQSAGSKDSAGVPLLFVAIRNEDPETALALLRAGAAPDTAHDGVPALTAAIHHGLAPVVDALLARKARVAPKVPHPRLAPLQAAIDAGAPGLAAELVVRGARADLPMLLERVDRRDLGLLLGLLTTDTPAPTLAALLERAVFADATIASTLLARGASPARSARPLVRVALDQGDASLARMLVEAGGDATTARGDWPLVPAAARGDVALLRLMLRAGAKADGADPRTSESPVGAAVRAGQLESLEALLEAGATPDAAMPDGEPALLFALRTGQAAVVRALLDANADANAAWKGLRPIHLAAHARNVELATLLLRRGADVNVTVADTGTSALHLAAEHGDLPMVERLLESGADPTLAIVDGRTAYDLAREGGYADVAARLAPARPAAKAGADAGP